MTALRAVALALVLTAASARDGGAVTVAPRHAVPPWPGPSVVQVDQRDIPDVVRLLAERAVRAERRGDMETARELYETIRRMGYTVRRPGAEAQDDRSRERLFSRGDRGGSDGDDPQDDDDDDGDAGSGGSGGGDSGGGGSGGSGASGDDDDDDDDGGGSSDDGDDSDGDDNDDDD